VGICVRLSNFTRRSRCRALYLSGESLVGAELCHEWMGRVYADFRSKAAKGDAEAQAWLAISTALAEHLQFLLPAERPLKPTSRSPRRLVVVERRASRPAAARRPSLHNFGLARELHRLSHESDRRRRKVPQVREHGRQIRGRHSEPVGERLPRTDRARSSGSSGLRWSHHPVRLPLRWGRSRRSLRPSQLPSPSDGCPRRDRCHYCSEARCARNRTR